ncbi:hypothetical protein FSARC_1951 [Fusarium sarcochroum]|uniref:Uncharacterized protein n=1 Tax=Fusarium sarcochroum TaxID=1208366 RepID=A0A8H4U819_9HYPO|nr:hypothetical protein FSARC_1951 [Fusarium sarcochroum]
MDICEYLFRGLGWLVDQPSFPRIEDQEPNQPRREAQKDNTSENNDDALNTPKSEAHVYLFLILVTTLGMVIYLVLWARQSRAAIIKMRAEIMEDIERGNQPPFEEPHELAPTAVAPEPRP